MRLERTRMMPIADFAKRRVPVREVEAALIAASGSLRRGGSVWKRVWMRWRS